MRGVLGRKSPRRRIGFGLMSGAVSGMVIATSCAALAADLPQRPHRSTARVVRPPVVVQVVPAPPSEYYERELYQGPPFFYRPYYGAGPSLQWFDFGLGRERDTYQ